MCTLHARVTGVAQVLISGWVIYLALAQVGVYVMSLHGVVHTYHHCYHQGCLAKLDQVGV